MSLKALKIVLAFLGLIPLSIGVACFILGPALMPGGSSVNASIDNEYRFLSVFWFACGLVIYRVIPNIEKQTQLFRFISGIIFLGGIGRLLSMIVVGIPALPYLVAMGLELVVVPIIVLWQASIAKR